MTALAHEASKTTSEAPMPPPDLDEVLWEAWKAMELPEGFHAEIVEGFIEVSPTGRCSHGMIINRLREELVLYLRGSDHASFQDLNVMNGPSVWIPDIFIAPRDIQPHFTSDGLCVEASAVLLVVEMVSPGHRDRTRDRVRKRRDYARAGIAVYVIIDDYDELGTVTVLSGPRPGEASYAAEHRVPYGTDIAVPEGPAKGFVIGEAITGPPRSG
ncbi:Uma2 family endonuclease [Streptomyces sp. NPDC052496]|uniref:Uma2 family endonuclease n=1 Tax=Streptomyces sp. NPDC052496 TaxID=3154951 RepID=UPI00342DE742